MSDANRKLTEAEIAQAVKAAKFCARIEPGGCSECPVEDRLCYGVMAHANGIPLVVLALAAELELAKQARVQAENERDELLGLLRSGRDVVNRLNEAEPGESDPAANKWLHHLSMIPAINLPGVDFPFPTGDSDDAAGGGK